MNWWGKILGGAFGMMLGGPAGAILGAALGHSFDKGLSRSASATGEFGRQQRAQTVFYTATFSIMGHICKLDGRISEDEIALARQVMQQMDMNAEQRQTAIHLFNEGKKDGFPLQDMLRQFRQEIGPRPNLLRMFCRDSDHGGLCRWRTAPGRARRIAFDMPATRDFRGRI